MRPHCNRGFLRPTLGKLVCYQQGFGAERIPRAAAPQSGRRGTPRKGRRVLSIFPSRAGFDAIPAQPSRDSSGRAGSGHGVSPSAGSARRRGDVTAVPAAGAVAVLRVLVAPGRPRSLHTGANAGITQPKTMSLHPKTITRHAPAGIPQQDGVPLPPCLVPGGEGWGRSGRRALWLWFSAWLGGKWVFSPKVRFHCSSGSSFCYNCNFSDFRQWQET